MAEDYIRLLGHMGSVHAADRIFIEDAFAPVDGLIVDAGCGPGHWTAHLHALGHHVRGCDVVPAFVSYARKTFPGITYDIGDSAHLHDAHSTVGGVLAWYSLIHMPPDELSAALQNFHRILAPGGVLVIGVVPGETLATFDHKVTPALAWPPSALYQLLERSRFAVARSEARPATESLRAHLAVAATALA